MHIPASGDPLKPAAEFEDLEKVSGILFEYDYPQKKKEEKKEEE